MTETLADKLTDYALGLSFNELPDNVVHETKRRFIDALGCSLGALEADAPKIAERVAHRIKASPGAMTIYGSVTSPDMAAFVNGIMIRYLDFNDTYLSKEPAHPSDNLAAVLAAGETAHCSGRELICASIVAYEVQCRMADAWSIRSQGWDHVCYGAFSTVLAAGRLLRLDKSQMVHALGISGVAHMAMRQTRSGELSMWKGSAFANTSRNGVLAALLAREGMSGPAPIFEGEMGFFAEVAHGTFELPDLGGRACADYMLPRTYIKNWPAEYHTQSAIDAALKIRHSIDNLESIESLLIETFDTAVEIIADPEKWRPRTRETADHSLPYCVAVAILDGVVGLEQFQEARFTDKKLLDLVSRVVVRADPAFNDRYPDSIPNKITVTMRDGRQFSEEVQYPTGHSGNPMTDAEVEQKFKLLARGNIDSNGIDEILRCLWSLEDLEDAHDLMTMFSGYVQR